MITPEIKDKIEQIVNVFETGAIEGKFDSLVVMSDGSGRSFQITYGRSQTTEQGNLRNLVSMYVSKPDAKFGRQLAPYLSQIGKVALYQDTNFKTLLIRAGKEDEVMDKTQDEFFDLQYFNPAKKFFDTNQFTLELSMLVIYDSYVHSGGILAFLRKRFGENVPVSGGDEKKWIASYVDVRNQWLKYHPNPLLRGTIYRTQCFKDLIARGEWNLAAPVNAHGITVPKPSN